MGQERYLQSRPASKIYLHNLKRESGNALEERDAMTPTELEHAEKRMQQKWYDLAMAEQKGAEVQALERMYNAYMLAVEEYNRCSAEYQHKYQDQPIPVPVKQERKSTGHKKKAS